ncbi:lysoplasmalogenase [Bacteroidota bacterium]
MTKNRIAATIFFIAAVSNLTSHILDIDWLTYISKPLLMVALAYYLIQSVPSQFRGKVFYLSLIALFFSWLGDILLMLSGNGAVFFMLGIGAFLLAQVSYTIDFQFLKSNYTKGFHFLSIIWALIVIIYSVNIWLDLRHNLGDFFVPVLAYLIVISLMAISAGSRYRKTHTGSFLLCYAGALVFMISDTLIAINKWHHAIENERLIVMATYILAQWMIINGIIMHLKMHAAKEA